MSTVPADLGDYSDAELIASVRNGVSAAYGTLYDRHVAAAYNLARQLTRSAAEADDLVAEAFAKVLDTLRGGKGPDSAFRAYLLTALRNTAYDRTRKDRKLDLTDDMADAGGEVGEALTVPFSDTAVSGLERSLAAKAFARLPERWQAVLWHTEIEQQSAGEVAPILGLTANGVSALAYRAREGLRQAYLQVHLAENEASRCRATADRLGAWTRSGLSKRERSQVEAHLDECERCRALAAELADVNGALRVAIAPLVLGGATVAYLSAAGATKAAGGTAATAATAGAAAASGGAGGAAGAASAGPRQFAGVATSVTAMAAAAAVAIAAGGASQEIPTAAAEPPASQAPTQQAPAPRPAPEPAPPAAPGEPPQQAPQPAPDEPAPTQPPSSPSPAPPPPPLSQRPEPPPPPPEAPEPAPADVVADVPQDEIALVPGGPPAQLPVTVRNDGGSVSEPVVTTLNLPPGVHATRAGGGGGSPMSAAAAKQQDLPRTLHCPASTGRTVTCRTQQGLAPGESVVLLFQLGAVEGAEPGTVTGTVSSGDTLSIAIPPVPVVTEDVTLAVQRERDPHPQPSRPGQPLPASWHWPWHETLRVEVSNTGGTTSPVTVTVHGNARAVAAAEFSCTGGQGEALTCTSTESLAPGQSVNLRVELGRALQMCFREVNVTATLGAATDSESEHVGIVPCAWQHPDPPRPSNDPEPIKPTTPARPSVGSSDASPSSRTPASTPTETKPTETSGPASTQSDEEPAPTTTTTTTTTTSEQQDSGTETEEPERTPGRPDEPPRGPGHPRGKDE